MYQSPQKKSSSWTVTSIQKKSKSFSKPGSSAVSAKRDANSAQSQDMPSYSTPGADLLTANIMRSVETEEHSEVLDSTVQRQSEPGGAAVAATAPPIVSIPVVQPNSVGIQRQCSECASQQQQQSGEEGKDVLEMSEAASGIQTKLTVGAPGDIYEQEADRVAAQVMSMPVAAAAPPQVQRFGEEHNPIGMYSSLARSITPVVQRRVDQQVQMYSRVQRAFQSGGNEASGDLESRLNASKGGGSALAPEVRAFMEPRFGADFSSVRVHTGGEAIQMNRELGAQAFTHGRDIYFGTGKSPGNNELTAHELTHVVQQTGGVQLKLTDNQQRKDEYKEGSDQRSSEKVSRSNEPPQQDIRSISTPIIQASFISFAIKMGAKKASKGMLKNFIKTQIKQRVTKYLNKRVAKQFLEEADQILSVLEDPWWVTAIGFIPIAGDAFDLVRVPMQIREAIRRANGLESKVKLILRRQWELKRTLKVADPVKVVNTLKSFSGKSFKLGSENLQLDKKGMKHILERHHPDFWDGSVKEGQSFLDPKMNIDDITNAIESVLRQNYDQGILPKSGSSNLVRQFEGTYNGVKYKLGLNKGRIGQLYPLN